MDIMEQTKIDIMQEESPKRSNIKKRIKYAVLTAAVLMCLAIALYAFGIYRTQQFNVVDASKTQVEVLVDELNVRESPYVAANKLDTLTKGDILTVADTFYTNESAWYEIRIGCWKKAYIYAGEKGEYLKLLVPKDAPVNSNSRDKTVVQIEIIDEFRNIRADNNVKAQIVGRATKNDIYTVLDIVMDRSVWYKVKTTSNIEGWISGTTGVKYLHAGNTPYIGVYEAKNGKAISENGCEERIFPASLTKLFTAYTAMQYVSLETEMTVGTEIDMISSGSSKANITKGQTFSLSELIAGMLIPSGNDAAYSVAVNVARIESKNTSLSDDEAVKYFCDLMNLQIEKLGLGNSHFVNPDGWDAQDHYTTVQDIAMISLELLKTQAIRDMIDKCEMTITSYSGEKIVLKNTNQLLNSKSEYYCKIAHGLKTGSTDLAGKCLAALVNVDGCEYIIVSVCNSDEEQRYQSVLHEIEKLNNR